MARRHLETVLNAILPLAKVELQRQGRIPPLGGSLDESGEVDLHVMRPDDGGSSEEALEILRRTLRNGARRGSYRATGLCREVQAERPGDDAPVDALCIHLEAKGESLHAFLPYRRNEDGRLEFDEVFFGPADPDAFEE